MEKQNFTLSVPAPLLKKLRIYAAKHEKSMTAVINEFIREKVEMEDTEYEGRKRRAIERMRNAPNLGTGGKVAWTREELHERR